MIFALMLLAVIAPTKTWFAPDKEWTVTIKPQGDVRLLLTDYAGRPITSQGPPQYSSEQTVDLKAAFPAIVNPGTYVLFEVPPGAEALQFTGTPLVIDVRRDKRPGAPEGPMVVKVSPLQYAVMQTAHGPLTIIFYYDVAPHTVENFIQLSQTNFYDGLTFHRIVPGFVVQGGDPRGNGSGGPGYTINAEFNDRAHDEGVVSMARTGDPNEASGGMPRSEFANSAGSQFFICLDYKNTKNLDHRYTAFAKVTDGMDTVKAIAKTPVADQKTGRPEKPVVIQKVELMSVTAKANPYATIIAASFPTTLPTTNAVP